MCNTAAGLPPAVDSHGVRVCVAATRNQAASNFSKLRSAMLCVVPLAL